MLGHATRQEADVSSGGEHSRAALDTVPTTIYEGIYERREYPFARLSGRLVLFLTAVTIIGPAAALPQC